MTKRRHERDKMTRNSHSGTAERNRATVRRVFEEIINRQQLGTVDEIYQPDIVDHDPVPGAPSGIEGVKYSVSALLQAFPDLHVTVEDMSSYLDKVVVHNTWRGTQTGSLVGLPPSGKKVVYTGIVVWRLEDGKIAERWAMTEILNELGAPQRRRTRRSRGFIREGGARVGSSEPSA